MATDKEKPDNLDSCKNSKIFCMRKSTIKKVKNIPKLEEILNVCA